MSSDVPLRREARTAAVWRPRRRSVLTRAALALALWNSPGFSAANFLPAGDDPFDGTGHPVFSRGILPAPPPAPKAPPAMTPSAPPAVRPPESVDPPPAAATPPAPDEAILRMARRAWPYFENNLRPATGWFDSVEGHASTTLWDLGSGIAAVACAGQLGLIPRERAGQLLGRALDTLARIPLYNGELPNRSYSTASAQMDGPLTSNGRGGTGWSALDIGRLLVWLRLAAAWHPEHAGRIRSIVAAWKFERLARNGEMHGTLRSASREQLRQEGRLGYEQYAARGFELWGLPMARARGYAETQPFELLGVALSADRRNRPYLTSEPFLLAAIELGTLDPHFTALTQKLYEVQRRRWEQTRILTAVSEDAIGRSPWFVYYSVSYQGKPWHCVDHAGAPAPGRCGFSTKAAFGWAALHDDDYAARLQQAADALFTPRGYRAGREEGGADNPSLNINTNAVILEALLFRQRGRRPFLDDVRDAVPER